MQTNPAVELSLLRQPALRAMPTRCKNEMIWVNVSNTGSDVIIAVVFRCFRWNLLIFIGYLCNVFGVKNVEKTLGKFN